MKHSNMLLVLGVALLASASAYAGNIAPPGANPKEHSENGVLATEDAWSHAEAVGDTDFLQGMLAPEYRSVNPDGSVHPKDRIIAGAAKSKGHEAAQLKAGEDYLRAHPIDTHVYIHGDTAIASFYVKGSDPNHAGLRSSDIFVYENGGWHAIYSQHSVAEK